MSNPPRPKAPKRNRPEDEVPGDSVHNLPEYDMALRGSSTRKLLRSLEDPSSRNNLFRMLFLSGVMAITVIVIVYLMTEVRGKLSELSSTPQDNVQWGLAQFEVEYLEYTTALVEAHALSRTGVSPDDPQMTRAIAHLRRRYDILYSRVYTVRDSQIYGHAFVNPVLASTVTETGDKILNNATIIDQPTAELIPALPALIEKTHTTRGQIRRIMTFGNQALTRASDAGRNDMATVLQRLAVATAVLLVTLATMIVLFRRMARVSDTRLRENLVTSERLAKIFSTSRDAIAVIDRNGMLIGLNDAGQTMFNLEEAEARGRRVGSILRRNGVNELERVRGHDLFTASSSDHKTGLRLTGMPRGGDPFPVEVSVDVTRDQSPICVCVVRDISRQVAAEAALKESRDKALAGERAKARFMRVVSHEMRTPLNGIMGTMDLLAEEIARPGAEPKEVIENYLPVLRISSETLLDLVNDVLDITQIESGVRIVKSAFDFDDLVANVVANETARARERGNAIDISIAKPIGRVIGDAPRIRQVLANLVSNAVKFTRDGRVTIEAVRQRSDTVEIQVVDTGMGMSDEDLARVFDDFVRTDRAVEAQIQGTGLGLGIARTLIEAMDGHIGAESEEGEGSLFWIRLPLPLAPAEDDSVKPPEIELPPVPPSRILIVEDNGTNRFIARRLLENDGHHVVEAADGKAGVLAAQSEVFDLILMDISMPVMDGIAATHAIRQGDGVNQSTRIVALTAHLSGGFGRDGEMNVMQHVLHKPLQREELRNEVRIVHGLMPDRTEPTAPRTANADIMGDVSGADTITGQHVTTPQGSDTTAPRTSAKGTSIGSDTRTALRDLIASTDPKTARRLINAFITEADESLPDLTRRAFEPGRKPDDRLAEDLHALGGVAASFGARAMHLALIRAETAERVGNTEKTAQLIAQAVDIWPEIRDELAEPTP